MDSQETVYFNMTQTSTSCVWQLKRKKADKKWCHMIKESIKKLHWQKSGLMVEGMGWGRAQ